MAKRRAWESLAPSTRQKYVSRGRALGQSDAQVRQHYELGGNMAFYRGHPTRYGVGERMWRRLRAAAKRAELDKDMDSGDVNVPLSSLLAKGFTPEWILRQLEDKMDSRSTYRTRAAKALRKQFPKEDWGFDPGRTRFHRRNLTADIELYYYH